MVRTENEKNVGDIVMINATMYAKHKKNGKLYQAKYCTGYILGAHCGWYEFKRKYIFFKIPLTNEFKNVIINYSNQEITERGK